MPVDLGIDDVSTLILAEEYKMPESEFAARFTEAEIDRIWLLRAARGEADKIRHPELYKNK